MKNKYYWHSRLSEKKFRQIVRCFAEDKTAVKTSIQTDLDRTTVNRIFLKIRRRVLKLSSATRPKLPIRNFFTKQPYFVAETEKECRKYSAQNKSKVLVTVFNDGLLRADIIYAKFEETFAELSQSIKLLEREAIQHCNYYDFTATTKIINDWQVQVSRLHTLENHSLWLLLYFQWRIKKFKGISRDKFILHLRESEWRTNKIPNDEEFKQKLRNNVGALNLISNDIINELLEDFLEDPL